MAGIPARRGGTEPAPYTKTGSLPRMGRCTQGMPLTPGRKTKAGSAIQALPVLFSLRQGGGHDSFELILLREILKTSYEEILRTD